ncbi:caspase recruitment domain-containing protein 8 [Sarotherodon galilaeus]
MHLGLSSTPKQHIESLKVKMSGRGDGSQNNRNGRQVNPEMFPSGDQEPAYEPANEPIGGLRGFLNNLYLGLYNIFWRLDELIDELEERYDDIHNINVRDNNANADNNEQHDDHNAAVVVVGIENDDSDEAFEDCVDVHQYIPEEDPQPGVSRRRCREMDEEDVEPNKRIRWSEEFSDDDSDFFSACDTDSEGCPHVGNIADEDSPQQVTEEELLPGGSTKRSREEDVDEEERNSKKSRLANSDSGISSAVYDHSESSRSGPERILRKKRNSGVFANFRGVQMSPPAPVMTTNTISTGFFSILFVG